MNRISNGDRVSWVNFGGIEWTGTGTVCEVKYEKILEVEIIEFLKVKFDRSDDLTKTRDKISRSVGKYAGGPYPFGDDDEPVIFVGDAVMLALHRGFLKIIPPTSEKKQ